PIEAMTYDVGRSTVEHAKSLADQTANVLSVTSDGRLAVISAGGEANHTPLRVFLWDTETEKQTPLPEGWYRDDRLGRRPGYQNLGRWKFDLGLRGRNGFLTYVSRGLSVVRQSAGCKANQWTYLGWWQLRWRHHSKWQRSRIRQQSCRQPAGGSYDRTASCQLRPGLLSVARWDLGS